MDIDFKAKKLEKICNTYALAKKEYGEDVARKLMQRLNELRAAECLGQISHLPPPQLHEIGGIRPGCYGIHLKEPFRLVIKPANTPVPKKQDGGIDLQKVNFISVIEVEDYHGKRKKK